MVTSLPSTSTPEPKCETPKGKTCPPIPTRILQPSTTAETDPHLVHQSTPKGKAFPKAAPPPIPSKAGPPVQPSQPSRPSVAGKAPPPIPVAAPKMVVAPPPPPPPPSKAGPSQRMSFGGVTNPSSSPNVQNDFINIHWKPASSMPAAAPSDHHDQFLKPFVDDSLPAPTVEKLLLLDPVPPVIDPDASVFHPDRSSPVPVPIDTLKQYFQKKQNKLDIGGTGSSSSTTLDGSRRDNNGRKTALEKERLKLIALAIGGSLGIRSAGNKRGIFRQYRDAIIRCDYTLLRTEILCPLLQLLNNVTVEEMSSVVNLIKEYIENRNDQEILILDEFEEPDVFLYEMSKIPEIKTRIECMILEQSFEDLFQITVNSLNVIYTALEVLFNRIDDITRLFQIILRIGNALNEGSKLGGNQTTFSLSTLSKLSELKSSLDPKVDLLHYILSLIPPEESPCIFSDSDLVKLKNAASLRCFRVRDEVKDLLESVGAIADIIGNPVPQAVGVDDAFNERMKAFSDRISGTEKWLSIYALNVFRSYKNLSNYFEDTKSVYPPPKEKTNDQFDIIELFAWFASVLRGHEKDIKRLKLRQKIGTTVGGNKTKSRRPSTTTQDALHTSIKALVGDDNALPIAALITRLSGDLTASKPKLSPIPSPVVDVVVVPADTPKTAGGGTIPSAPKRRLLTTKGTASIVSGRGVSVPQAGLSVAVSGPPIPTRKNSLEGTSDSYPVRREGLPDPEVSLNTRVSLSNTISRVAMLLSPSRDDNNPGSAYMGSRRNRMSVIGSLETGS